MAHFDFPYTCPSIDKAIRQAEETISSHIHDLLEEACPLLDLTTIGMRDHINASAKSLYSDIEECFEKVRETNERMRHEAESQLKTLQGEIDNLKYELENQSA
jgi:hypothetical protein